MTTDEAIKEPCEYCKVLTPDMCCGFTLPSIHGDEDGDVVTITHCPMCGRLLKGEGNGTTDNDKC